jgi:uncharacterized repeat protein (TIGR01451 family)
LAVTEESAMHTRALATVALPTAILLMLVSASSAAAAAATDLSVRSTAGSLRVGAVATYAVTVANRGPAATDAPIHVLDDLPAGLSFAGVTGIGWSCSVGGASVDCVHDDSLGVGRSTTFRFRVSVCTAAFPSVTNIFHLVYPADVNGANDFAIKTKVVRAGSCTALPATPTNPPGPKGTPTSTPTASPTRTAAPSLTNLQLTKTTGSTFTVGGNGLYSLGVSNLGPANTNGVITIVDTLPTGLTYVSGSGVGWACSAAAQKVTCSTSSVLNASTSTAVTLSVAVGSAAYPTVTNTAVVSYAGDTDLTNNSAQKPTTIRQ